MDRLITESLKVITVLIGIIILAGLIRFPQTEGRAIDLGLISIYKDSFIIYIYISSIPFFILLYQSFKFLGYSEKNKTNTKSALNALRNIKYCGVILIGLIFLAILYIRVFVNGDDPAGPTSLGIFTIFVFSVIAIVASVFRKRLQKTIDGKR